MDTRDVLFRLSSVSSVSGNEAGAFSELGHFLESRFGKKCIVNEDKAVLSFGERTEGKPHILIDAHMDEIGMIVTFVDEEGFIVPGNIGGMDIRMLPSQRVVVHGTKDIPGIVSSIPPHLSGDRASDIGSVRIDTGFSEKELRKYVKPGDTISFASECHTLLNGRVSGKSFDNRAGALVLIRTADKLMKTRTDNCSYSFLFSSAEEIGERGAKTACFEIDPDIAIAVDVSFAACHGENPSKCGKMGEGPMIGFSPSLSREITEMLCKAAERIKIPYQKEVMNGLTGTNADQFSVCRKGVKTCTVSVPLKYMHTSAEVIDIKDIELASDLLAEFIRTVNK